MIHNKTWILKTCQVNEDKHKKSDILLFYLYEMSRIAISIETERWVTARSRGRRGMEGNC